ncbi:hypothetical protein ORI20_06240 [Mycobacterium sp. CVI_P3]|uniref:TetR family transcriptional regulator n=1 Tax=Mycobacterium pinniadriaticum TaxID=2994102 RepID=A0ABT3SBG9_9MYCO|nr:hypothetical protein [Mycobacterium pinniadriaticum]MCX2929862.1 hypothetical protein [Mycobacterium pinniadriaticum]MCX2936489.1 hypothetical protein [Mycobacterium pinniadriaticum]
MTLLGRAQSGGATSRSDRLESLTGRESSESDSFQLQIQLAVCNLTRRIADAAAAASAQGADGGAVITRTVDEWMRVDDGNGIGWVPVRLFFPPLWWIDLPRPPRPDELVELVPALAAAAWSFLLIAESVYDPSLNEAIHTAIDAILGRAERSLPS